MGNQLSETTAQGILQHQYDKLGNRIATTLPDGRTINKLYYGSGHLHQINLDGQIISDIERDHLHRETLRSQGRMNTSFQYDRTGRLTGKQTKRPGAGILPDIILDRSYSYDNLDRLVSKKHNRQGQSDYRYDVTGRIESCRNESYWETLQYDAAANLLDRRRGEEESNQNLIRFNQLLSFRGLKYSYDEHGRTRSKQTASGTQYYHYDAEHRLTEVRIEQLNHTERYGYVYDALGRRIEKHRLDRDGKPCNRTTFLWDGLQMIQESSADKRQSLYLYTDEGSYEPLARIDRTGNQEQHIYYFHTDLNGMPEELTDEAGEIVWECSYQLWGKPIQEIAHTEIQQNLRYQGQYLDRETGLHYNTFRYYDPDIGRFTQPDPIGLLGGFNLYQYAPNGLTWVDPLGLRKCTTGFKNANDAGRAALSKYNPMSIFKNREYGGIIFKAKDGTYGYTRGRLGSGRTAPTFKESAGGLPKGSTPVGQYHTHGDYSDINFNRTNKAGDVHNSDKFSNSDISIHNRANKTFPNYTNVLGAPSGSFWKIFGKVSGPDDAIPL